MPKNWRPLAVIGGVAILAGIILPQILPSVAPVDAVRARTSDTGSTNPLVYTPPAWPEPPNHGAMFLRLGLGTCLVLGICVGTLWCCKRWLRGAVAVACGAGQLKLIETLPLGNRCCVFLVHVGNRPVLIGADGSGVKTVVPLPESFAGALEESQAVRAVLDNGELHLSASAKPQAE